MKGRAWGEDAQTLGMLHNIDQNVGKLMTKLDALGIAKDTLVVYMNDNGGTAGVKTFNAGMRASKGSPWIGGVRAISFWRWPGTLKPDDWHRADRALRLLQDRFCTWRGAS